MADMSKADLYDPASGTVLERFRHWVIREGSAPSILVEAVDEMAQYAMACTAYEAACVRLAAEIDSLRVAPIDWWQPIETAPVPPREVLMYDRWRCLMQSEKGWVTGGYAAYARKPGIRVETYRVQWYDGKDRVFHAKYWMPLPAPRAS